MTRDDAGAWVVFRRLSREEVIEAFAPTVEELVEQLGAYQPGEFVEAVIREPLDADDLRPRLETAAARLGWELRWAPRGPAGSLRFQVTPGAAASLPTRRLSRKRSAPTETPVTAPSPVTPAVSATSETAALPTAPRVDENAGPPPAPIRVRRPRPTPAKPRPATPEPMSADDAALEEVLADAVGRFGVQARELEVITWVRMHHPTLAGDGKDLPERVRRVLRTSGRFTPGARRSTWRLARGAA